jgi:hypothetical protein
MNGSVGGKQGTPGFVAISTLYPDVSGLLRALTTTKISR